MSDPQPLATVGAVMVDCLDPERLLDFWGEVLGVEAAHRYPDFIFCTPIPGNRIRLAFQRVPEEKVVKNRMHFDVTSPDPESFIARVIELGGSRVADHGDEAFSWTVLADPEGNEFCVTANG